MDLNGGSVCHQLLVETVFVFCWISFYLNIDQKCFYRLSAELQAADWVDFSLLINSEPKPPTRPDPIIHQC